MKYVWASITKSGVNYGNWIIEDCLRKALKLPKPDLVVDTFHQKFPQDLNSYSFIINPGSTTLYPDSGLAFKTLKTGIIPVICFGGSIWVRDKRDLKDRKTLLMTVKKLWQPVGCRDPFTFSLLRQEGIKAKLIGCPVLLSKNQPPAQDYIAFSFARQGIGEQIKLAKSLVRHSRLKIVIHEKRERDYCQGIRAEIVAQPNKMLSTYQAAKSVVTGRLHGALSAMSAERPLLYFQDRPHYDSRLSLLSYLDLPIRQISQIKDAKIRGLEYSIPKINQLRNSFRQYIELFKEKFS